MTEALRAPDRLERTWYSPATPAAVVRVTVYLVDAPISFGHSQLVVELSERTLEEDSFAIAAQHIVKCIRAFRRVLPSSTSSYGRLADYTHTNGSYLKTALLRASANEGTLEYKVHLVPIFESHLEAMNLLHQKTQHLTSPSAGGMLHWVGRREAIIDSDAGDRSSRLYHERVASFRLGALASDLRQSLETP